MTAELRRETHLEQAAQFGTTWDLAVVGGGATGMGVAVDAAARGYSVVLVEKGDFGRGTSSRSTKLVHGGVRYLQQGNIALVLDALRERGIMRENAPHLVHDLPFIVPNYTWWEAPFYGIGLRLYDLLAGRQGFGASANLTLEETLERIPTIETEGLRGGVVYYDGQFDDARLVVGLMRTAINHGAVCVNYAEVIKVLHHNGMVGGLVVHDHEAGAEFRIRARAVVNATGAFVDSVRRMDDRDAARIIRPSQGVHLVLAREFLPGDSAIMVPHTDDGRVLFVIPWRDRALVGTTDTPIESVPDEPTPLAEEVEFLLKHAARYLSKRPTREDVLSVFAGVRPLVDAGGESTAAISRDHTVNISRTGLVTITGGKWTTYRRMAEDTVDHAAIIAELEPRPCPTKELRIHGYVNDTSSFGALAPYGSDALLLHNLMREQPGWDQPLHPKLPVLAGEIVWAARHEMARTVEDVLSRRTRALLLDARASVEAAPKAAQLLAAELGRGQAWIDSQISDYTALAQNYILK